MATGEQPADAPSGSFLEKLLDEARKRYIEEHGEEPPEESENEARKFIIRQVAKEDCDEHRDIYCALAYYHDHPNEMEAARQRRERSFDEHRDSAITGPEDV